MPSSRSKGHATENLYKKLLEAQGYQCSPQPKKVMWIKGRSIVSDADYWGCIDIIAFNKDHWRITQVTHWENSNQYPRMKKILEFASHHPFPDGTLIECVAFRGGRKRLDPRYKKEKKYIPNQLFYVYSLIFNEFKETMRIHKSGEILWQLKDFYEAYK